jgi:hypothetical protein
VKSQITKSKLELQWSDTISDGKPIDENPDLVAHDKAMLKAKNISLLMLLLLLLLRSIKTQQKLKRKEKKIRKWRNL